MADIWDFLSSGEEWEKFGKGLDETVATLASGIGSSIIGGASGVASMPFLGVDKGAEIMKAIQNEYTYKPDNTKALEWLNKEVLEPFEKGVKPSRLGDETLNALPDNLPNWLKATASTATELLPEIAETVMLGGGARILGNTARRGAVASHQGLNKFADYMNMPNAKYHPSGSPMANTGAIGGKKKIVPVQSKAEKAESLDFLKKFESEYGAIPPMTHATVQKPYDIGRALMMYPSFYIQQMARAKGGTGVEHTLPKDMQEKPFSIDELDNKYVMGLRGDSSGSGYKVVDTLNGVPLDSPTVIDGGFGFPKINSAPSQFENAPQKAWQSMSGAGGRFIKNSNIIGEKVGENPIATGILMHPVTSPHFSAMPASLWFSQLKHLNPSKQVLKDIVDGVRNKSGGKKDFLMDENGNDIPLDSDEARNYLLSKQDGAGKDRTRLMDEASKVMYQIQGTPSMRDIQNEVTADSWKDTDWDTDSVGATFIETSPHSKIFPDDTHSSYDSGIEGKYFMDNAPIPLTVRDWFPDFWKSQEGAMTNPEKGAPRELTDGEKVNRLTSQYGHYQHMRPEVIDSLGAKLEVPPSQEGFISPTRRKDDAILDELISQYDMRYANETLTAEQIKRQQSSDSLNKSISEYDEFIPNGELKNVGSNDLGVRYESDGGTISVMENSKWSPRPNSVTNFVVDESKRGLGLGGQMLDDLFKKYDIDSISAQASSEPSVRAFYSRGLRPFGEEGATLEDALKIMKENSSVPLFTPEKLPKNYGKGQVQTDLPMDEASRMERAEPYNYDFYHASTHPDINELDATITNPQNDWGEGIYGSNAIDDINTNYAGVGSDLVSRINNRAEEISVAHYDEPELLEQLLKDNNLKLSDYADDPEAYEAIAEKELIGDAKGGVVYPLKANTEGYAVVGGNKSTILDEPDYKQQALDNIERKDYDSKDDYLDGLDTEESELRSYDYDSLSNRVNTALNNVSYDYGGFDIEPVIRDIELEMLDGSLDVRSLDEAIRNNVDGAYDEVKQTNIGNGAVSAKVLKELGYKGVIDNTVNKKFGAGGTRMEGVDAETQHIITFPDSEHRIRSKNAVFDPTKKHLANLMASGVLGTAGYGLLSDNEETNKFLQ